VHVERWTGGTAQGYRPCMYKPTLLIPLMFILVDGVRCKDDEPTGAQFGEACADEGQPCADGFQCEQDYCAPVCVMDSDCEVIKGYRHECINTGACRIVCDEKTLECPQDLGVPMTCVLGRCASAL